MLHVTIYLTEGMLVCRKMSNYSSQRWLWNIKLAFNRGAEVCSWSAKLQSFFSNHVLSNVSSDKDIHGSRWTAWYQRSQPSVDYLTRNGGLQKKKMWKEVKRHYHLMENGKVSTVSWRLMTSLITGVYQKWLMYTVCSCLTTCWVFNSMFDPAVIT